MRTRSEAVEYRNNARNGSAGGPSSLEISESEDDGDRHLRKREAREGEEEESSDDIMKRWRA